MLLSNGLPSSITNEIEELNIILIISIGNSMGWPYLNYVDYDVSNLYSFENKLDFLHVTAHEINHIFVGQLLGKEGIAPEDFFLQNFAYEGLAVHFNNNLATLYKGKKLSHSFIFEIILCYFSLTIFKVSLSKYIIIY